MSAEPRLYNHMEQKNEKEKNEEKKTERNEKRGRKYGGELYHGKYILLTSCYRAASHTHTH